MPSETCDPEDLDKGNLEELRVFYAGELLRSGMPLNGVAAPSGLDNVQLDLVRHCESIEGDIGIPRISKVEALRCLWERF